MKKIKHKLIEYRVKFDAMGQPFFVNTETGQSWHIGHKVIHNARPILYIIDSFYLEGVSDKYLVKPEHNNRTFINVQAFLVGIDGTKIGYANINTLKSVETPTYSYHSNINPCSETPLNIPEIPKKQPNYKYLLIQ